VTSVGRGSRLLRRAEARLFNGDLNYGNGRHWQSAEVGTYFRNNLWWWHPLWTYLEEVAPHLTEGVNGAKYATKRACYLASLTDEPCEFCDGTGTRQDGLAIGRNTADFPCNGCGGKGMVRPWNTNYDFSVSNVAEFRDFVAASGGFEIW